MSFIPGTINTTVVSADARWLILNDGSKVPASQFLTDSDVLAACESEDEDETLVTVSLKTLRDMRRDRQKVAGRLASLTHGIEAEMLNTRSLHDVAKLFCELSK